MRILCSINWHAWGRWAFVENYTDTSWGNEVGSSMWARECTRCGVVKSRSEYGLTIGDGGAA